MLTKLAQSLEAPPAPPKTEPQTFTGEVPQKGTGWGRIELGNLFKEWLAIEKTAMYDDASRQKLEDLEQKIVAEIQNMKEPFTLDREVRVDYTPQSFPKF